MFKNSSRFTSCHISRKEGNAGGGVGIAVHGCVCNNRRLVEDAGDPEGLEEVKGESLIGMLKA